MINYKGNSFKHNNLPSPSSYLDIILVNDVTDKMYLSTEDRVCKPPKNGFFNKSTYKIYEVDKKEKSFLQIVKLQTENPRFEFSLKIKFKYKIFNSEIFWHYYTKTILKVLSFEEILKNKIKEDAKVFFDHTNINDIERNKLENVNRFTEKQIEDFKNKGINISDIEINTEISSELNEIIEKCKKVYNFNKNIEVPTKDYSFRIKPDINYKISNNNYLIEDDKFIDNKILDITKKILSLFSKNESGVDYKKFEKDINSKQNILKENFANYGFYALNISFIVSPSDKILNLEKEGRFEFKFNLDSKDDVIGKFKFFVYFDYKVIDILKFLEYGENSIKNSIKCEFKKAYSAFASEFYICEIKKLNEEINKEEFKKSGIFKNFEDEYGIKMVSLFRDVDVKDDSKTTYITKKNLEEEFYVTSSTDEYRFRIKISANYNFVRPDDLKDLNDENIDKMLKTIFMELIQKESYKHETKDYINLEKKLNKFLYDSEIKKLLNKDGFTINKYHILICDVDVIGPGKQIPNCNSVYNGYFEMEVQDEINGTIFIKIDYTFEIKEIFYKAVEDYKKIIKGFLNSAVNKCEKKIKDHEKWYQELDEDVENLKKSSLKDKNIELVTYSISSSDKTWNEKSLNLDSL